MLSTRQALFPIPPRKVTQDQARNALAGVVLDEIWRRVAHHVGGSMRSATWRLRNIRAAREMIEAGLTPERILLTHARMTAERGAPIYTLRWVHDRIVRDDSRRSDGLAAAGWLPSPTDELPRLCDLPAAE